MPMELTDDLKEVWEVCKTIDKSSAGEFSYKWLRLEGHTFHHSKLTKLVKLG